LIFQRACRKNISLEIRLRRVLQACLISAALFLPLHLSAQEPEQIAPTSLTANTPATVQGMVIDTSTGQPLPRALVKIEGDTETGALTDSGGRFEIPGVPSGSQAIQVTKPGYRDRPQSAGAAAADDTATPAHNITVAAGMPDLLFTMEQTSSIHGQVEFSNGDPAPGIKINLLKQTVEDGRAIWTQSSVASSDSEGAYRFAGLADGVYVMYTEPAMDTEPVNNTFSSGRAGYASVFFSDARDLAGAARIQLSSGDQAQANLTLSIEPFQTVTASLAFPQDQLSDRAPTDFSATIMDAAGHQLPYGAGYSQQTRTLQALLPDGSYSLLATSAPHVGGNPYDADQDAGQLAGTVDFTVAGHEVTNLRIPLTVPHPNPVQLAIVRTALPQAQSGATQGKAGEIQVMLSPAGGQTGGQGGGWIGEGIVSSYASGTSQGPMEASWLLPGSYWVHSHIAQKGLCEASFTAGGANLAREPVILGLNGSVSPMTLTLRDDCASLTLSLPQTLMLPAPGEEPFYTVYVVPDFDSTGDIAPVTLRASSGGATTIEDLTPGSYRVYIFNASARLEFRDRAVLAALPNQGQPVTLSAGTTSNLVLEAPQP
jgi:hypothetical protein